MTYKKFLIEAPAGYGKTETIANLVQQKPSKKKSLILTHTRAGVSNLKQRLKSKNVESGKYDLYTIDSFSQKFAITYKGLSKIGEAAPHDSDYYKKCREGSVKVFSNKDIMAFVKAKYDYLIVDEYQDCCNIQHELVIKLANHLDCVVLGDRLQAIYDFGEGSVKWASVRLDFPIHDLISLEIPYRWKNTNEDLGNWLQQKREEFLLNDNITVDEEVDDFVKIEKITNHKDYGELVKLVSKSIEDKKGTCLVITNSTNREFRVKICKTKTYGKQLYMKDSINCKEITKSLKIIDKILNSKPIDPIKLIQNLRKILECVMTIGMIKAFDKNFIKRFNEGLSRENALKNVKKENNKLLREFLYNFYDAKNIEEIFSLIIDFINFHQKNCRVISWDSLNTLKEIFSHVENNNNLAKEFVNIRQFKSHKPYKTKNTISTPLLTKGLEYDHVCIVFPDELKSNELYVSLTRAKKTITLIKKKSQNNKTTKKHVGIDKTKQPSLF